MTDSQRPESPKSKASPEKSPAPAGAKPSPSGPQTSAEGAPAPGAKPKPPAVEDKPFAEFIPQQLLPALVKECQVYGGSAPELSFLEGPMPVVGVNCWMVQGLFPGGRRFWLCFTAANLDAAKMVALAEAGAQPSLLESFLIDEKKMSLPLLVSRLVQRLNGQKWLGPN